MIKSRVIFMVVVLCLTFSSAAQAYYFEVVSDIPTGSPFLSNSVLERDSIRASVAAPELTTTTRSISFFIRPDQHDTQNSVFVDYDFDATVMNFGTSSATLLPPTGPPPLLQALADFANPWDSIGGIIVLLTDTLYQLDLSAWSGNVSYSNAEAELYIVGATPIPGAVWLLGTGLLGLVGIRRKFM